MNRRRLTLLPALLVFALALAACGGDDGGQTTSADAGSATPEQATTAPAPADDSQSGSAKTVSITADPTGGLSYLESEVTAKAGKVTIDLNNPSDVVHDVTIEQGGADVGATDRVTASSTSAKLDLDPGEYTFYCSITGHRGAGMEGTLIVE